jgi:hypothetical protein
MKTAMLSDSSMLKRKPSTQSVSGLTRPSSEVGSASVPPLSMSTAIDSIGAVRAIAHSLVTLGYHLVPCEPGGKRPLVRWSDSLSGLDAIDRWLAAFGGDINIAIHAGRSGVAVLDADTAEAERWVTEHCPETPMRARTPRGGMHFYFGAPARPPPPAVNLFGLGLDVRAGPSLIVSSPSWSWEHGVPWRWIGPVLPPTALPILDSSGLLREPLPQPFVSGVRRGRRIATGPIRDVTRWIMAVESVQGRNGSNPCFKVACRLVDAGFAWEEAWRWLCLWNASGKAIPPWSEAELRHKLRDAFARVGISEKGAYS